MFIREYKLKYKFNVEDNEINSLYVLCTYILKLSQEWHKKSSDTVIIKILFAPPWLRCLFAFLLRFCVYKLIFDKAKINGIFYFSRDSIIITIVFKRFVKTFLFILKKLITLSNLVKLISYLIWNVIFICVHSKVQMAYLTFNNRTIIKYTLQYGLIKNIILKQ